MGDTDARERYKIARRKMDEAGRLYSILAALIIGGMTLGVTLAAVNSPWADIVLVGTVIVGGVIAALGIVYIEFSK